MSEAKRPPDAELRMAVTAWVRLRNRRMSKASGSKGDAMRDDYEEFWSALPEKVLHPLRVPIIEAFWWIGEPLSAIALVDVLDGFMSMGDAAHHLRALDALDVVELAPVNTDSGTSRSDSFDVPYRLTDRDAGGGDARGAGSS